MQNHNQHDASWQAAIIDASSDAIISMTLDGVVLTWNPGAERMFGYHADEIVGQSVTRLTPPPYQEALAEVLAGVRGGEHIVQHETIPMLAGTAVFDTSLTISPIRDDAGTVVRIAAIVQDITGRKRAEAALRESEERLRSMIENLPGGAVFVLDRDLRYVVAEGEALATSGLHPDDLVGHTLHEALPPELAAQYTSLYRRALAGESFEHEHDAHKRTYLSRGVPLRAANGAVYAVLAVSYDITVRKQAEEAVYASEEWLRLVFASVQEYAIFTLDPMGRVTSWNEGAHRIKGYTAEEIIGQSSARFYVPDDVRADKATREMETALREGRLETENWRVRKDGSWFWANEIMTPLYSADHTHLGFTIICRDLTTRKQAEDAVARALTEAQAARQEAEAALQTRDQFLSVASHELRTPLTSLLGYANMLQMPGMQNADMVQRMTERIVRQTQRLNALIEQLLDISRLERGQFALTTEPVDLAAVVGEVVDEVRATLPTTTHRIEFTASHDAVLITGDGQRLHQVIHNLLTNAVKYSPAGGFVHATVQRTATEAVIEVRDEGIGIPQEVQARLFEPFYRAPNVGGQVSGFGLGLHIVHEIVLRHGGRIEVESVEGQGSTFRVFLPLRDAVFEHEVI